MICNKCNFNNEDTSNYCIKCGTYLKIKCNSCNKENSNDSKFCVCCGNPLFASVLYDFSKENYTLKSKLKTTCKPDTIVDTETSETKSINKESYCKSSNASESPLKHISDFSGTQYNTADKIEFKNPNRDFFYSPNEYAYVRCVKIYEKGFAFKAIDDYSSLYLPKEIINRFKLDIKINDYLWVELRSEFEQKENQCLYKNVRIITTQKHSIQKEIKIFKSLHKVGDIIKAPVTEKNNNFLLVNITPNFSVKLIQNQFSGNYSEYTKGKVYEFRIMEINEDDKKTYVKLVPVLVDYKF